MNPFRLCKELHDFEGVPKRAWPLFVWRYYWGKYYPWSLHNKIRRDVRAN